MDPRHPEATLPRIKELVKQYERVETDMGKATTSINLAELEREGGLVVQEICLVAPRLHESMIQKSRNRRGEIARGLPVEKPVEEKKLAKKKPAKKGKK